MVGAFQGAHGKECAATVRRWDATYRQALAAGATSITEPNDAPYGDRAVARVAAY